MKLFALCVVAVSAIRRHALPPSYFQVGLKSIDCSAANALKEGIDCITQCNSHCRPTQDPATYRSCLLELGPQCTVPVVMEMETPSFQQGPRKDDNWRVCMNDTAVLLKPSSSPASGEESQALVFKIAGPIDTQLCQASTFQWKTPRSGNGDGKTCVHTDSATSSTSAKPQVIDDLVYLPFTGTGTRFAVFTLGDAKNACNLESAEWINQRRLIKTTLQGVGNMSEMTLEDSWY